MSGKISLSNVQLKIKTVWDRQMRSEFEAAATPARGFLWLGSLVFLVCKYLHTFCCECGEKLSPAEISVFPLQVSLCTSMSGKKSVLLNTIVSRSKRTFADFSKFVDWGEERKLKAAEEDSCRTPLSATSRKSQQGQKRFVLLILSSFLEVITGRGELTECSKLTRFAKRMLNMVPWGGGGGGGL